MVNFIQLAYSYENKSNKSAQQLNYGITKLGPCTVLLDDGKKIDLSEF